MLALHEHEAVCWASASAMGNARRGFVLEGMHLLQAAHHLVMADGSCAGDGRTGGDCWRGTTCFYSVLLSMWLQCLGRATRGG